MPYDSGYFPMSEGSQMVTYIKKQTLVMMYLIKI